MREGEREREREREREVKGEREGEETCRCDNGIVSRQSIG
jgi:hypothetical protein